MLSVMTGSAAARRGSACARLIARLLSDRVSERLRAAQGVLHLKAKYGAERLEAACARALCCRALSYRRVESILKTGLDRQAIPETPPSPPAVIHPNIRGKQYYN